MNRLTAFWGARMRRPLLIWMVDGLILAFLFSFAAVVGWNVLRNWAGPAGSLSNDLYTPAIMFATGHGFVQVDVSKIPDIQAFEDFRTSVVDPSQWPEPLPILPLHEYQAYHAYLVWFVGLCWRVFGVSWETMKIPILLFFAISGGLVYGLFRLGMNRLMSVLGASAFLLTPAVLGVLPCLRDFGKAPFILAILLLLGHMIQSPRSWKRIFLYALALGLIQGVGIGFRRDVGMCTIPIVVVLAFSPLEGRFSRRFLFRGVAILVFVSAWTISGWPILRSFQTYGTLGFHDIGMGFSTLCDYNLGLHRASYERVPLMHDGYVSAAAQSFGQRTLNIRDDSEVKRAFVMQNLWMFPADMLTRMYAAVLRILGGVSGPWNYYGAICAALSLLLMAAWVPRTAIFVLFFLLFFCGHTCMQYHMRHAFHLSFLPYWFLGYLLAQTFRGIWGMREAAARQRVWMCLASPPSWTGIRLWRASVFMVITGTLLILPFWPLRYWQHNRIELYQRTCQALPLLPIATDSVLQGAWKAFLVRESISQSNVAFYPVGVEFRTVYAAVKFTAPPSPDNFWILYDHGKKYDFSYRANPCLASNASGPLTYYFPVYEYAEAGPLESRFVGIGLSSAEADRFAGMYLVRNLSDFGLLPTIAIPEDPDCFIARQGLAWPWSADPQIFMQQSPPL